MTGQQFVPTGGGNKRDRGTEPCGEGWAGELALFSNPEWKNMSLVTKLLEPFMKYLLDKIQNVPQMVWSVFTTKIR